MKQVYDLTISTISEQVQTFAGKRAFECAPLL